MEKAFESLSKATLSSSGMSSSEASTRSAPPSLPASSMASLRVPYCERIPPHLRHSEGHFRNARGQSLYYMTLFPEARRAVRGVVLHLHGLGDHCRRYLFVYERLCAAGFGVVAFDFVNHGSSDVDLRFHRNPRKSMPRGHIHRFQHLVDDANAFVSFVKASVLPTVKYKDGSVVSTLADAPWICAGISFGSLVAAHVVLSSQHEFRASVFASPTLGTVWTPKLRVEAAILRPIALLAPTARVVPAVDYEWICRDPGFLDDFTSDPLTSTDMMTARTGTQITRAMKALRKDARVENPASMFSSAAALFLGGSLDNVADMPSAVGLFDRMASADKEFKLFKGMYHCVYEDPESDVVFEYLTQWLRARCPKPRWAASDSESERSRGLSHNSY
jgi:acylglycerol lipase